MYIIIVDSRQYNRNVKRLNLKVKGFNYILRYEERSAINGKKNALLEKEIFKNFLQKPENLSSLDRAIRRASSRELTVASPTMPRVFWSFSAST